MKKKQYTNLDCLTKLTDYIIIINNIPLFKDKTFCALLYAKERYVYIKNATTDDIVTFVRTIKDADQFILFLIEYCLFDLNNQNRTEAFIEQMISSSLFVTARSFTRIENISNSSFFLMKLNNVINKLKNIISTDEEDIDKKRTAGELLGLLNSNDNYIDSKNQSSEYLLPIFVPLSQDRNIRTDVDVAVCPVTVAEYGKFLSSEDYKETLIKTYEDCCNIANEANTTIDDRITKIEELVKTAATTKWNSIAERLSSSIDQILTQYDRWDLKAQLISFLKAKNDPGTVNFNNHLEKIYSGPSLFAPLKWEDPNYNNPAFPIVGVNYFEALAYCRWLSGKVNNEKITYRLVTYQEWKKYFGDAIDNKEQDIKNAIAEGKLNIKKENDHFGRIETVGLRGIKSKSGVYDVYGNTYEMLGNACMRISYGKDDESLSNGVKALLVHRVSVGGSFLQERDFAYNIEKKEPYFGQTTAFQRNIDMGFRICKEEKKD